MAARNFGFHSAQEFDLSPFDGIVHETLELGRACVLREHRNMQVLGQLWRGIIDYAKRHRCRYLMGCSSVMTTDEREGATVFRRLSRHLAEPHFPGLE